MKRAVLKETRETLWEATRQRGTPFITSALHVSEEVLDHILRGDLLDEDLCRQVETWRAERIEPKPEPSQATP